MSQVSKWKTIGYAAAIFVTGAVSGGALGVYETKANFFAPPREAEMEGRIETRLQKKLDLTPDQVAKIHPIIQNAASELHAIRMDMAQRVNKVFEDSYAQLSALLNPDQKAKLDQMQKERREAMQAHWQEHRHPDHDGDGGPGGPHGPGGPGGGPVGSPWGGPPHASPQP